LVGALIYSESNFEVYADHGLKGVYGQSGIYAEKHPDNPFNPRTSKGNIFSCAFILDKSIRQARGSTLYGLKFYKGYCSEGERRARRVVRLMTTLF